MIVQSQALFTIGFAALLFRELPTRGRASASAIATVGLLMICGTVGYDFSVAAFAMIDDLPAQLCGRQSLAAARASGVPMFDLFAWLCLVAAVPLFALTLVSQRTCSRPGTR